MLKEFQTALLTALDGITPPIPTFYDNASGDKGSSMWQSVTFSMAPPNDAELTGGFRQEIGLMTIELRLPAGEGTGAGWDRVDKIKSAFYRGSSFTYGGFTVKLLKTPTVGKPLNDTEFNEWVVPVHVRFVSDVFT